MADVKTPRGGSPGARPLRGSPFVWRNTEAHHHLAAPCRPLRGPPPLSPPSPGLRAREAWPPGPGRRAAGVKGASRPNSAPLASRLPPCGRAASAASAPPARPAFVRRPGPAPPPDPGNTNRRRLTRPRSLSQTSPASSSPSPQLLLSGGSG